MAIQFVGLLAAQDISCGLGRIEKKLTNVSNKNGFTLMKLRPNFMADKRRWNWRASLTWQIKSPSVWKTTIPVCMLTGICLHWWFWQIRVENSPGSPSAVYVLVNKYSGMQVMQNHQISTCTCFNWQCILCRSNRNPASKHCWWNEFTWERKVYHPT